MATIFLGTIDSASGGISTSGTASSTKKFMKQLVSHYYPVSLLSYLGSGKEEKQDASYFFFEKLASVE